MTLPVLDRDDTLASVVESSRRLTELIRTLRAPENIAIGHWSARDTAVHVGHVFGMQPPLLAGARSPIENHLEIGEAMDRLVDAEPERDLAQVADRIERATKEFVNAATADAWEREVWWHGGLRVPVYSLAGILVQECEVHGRDIATADDGRWVIGKPKAIQAIVGLLPILPHFLDEDAARGVRASYELKLRGGPALFITIADGSLAIDATPRAVDCHLSVDPVDYILIGYGRKSQVLPILTGKVAAWGRKPWLALRFAKFLRSP